MPARKLFKSMSDEEKVLIIGAGPVGLYTALQLLESSENCQIKLTESRNGKVRPHVFNGTFNAVNSLPDQIKSKLWPDQHVKNLIFGNRSKDENGFWPFVEYKYLPIIHVGEFQNAILHYLEKFYSDRFEFVIEDSSVDELKQKIDGFDLVIVAAGNGIFTQNLRRALNISKVTKENREEIESRGIYLLYEGVGMESFERNGDLLRRSELSPAGITYAHSNDSSNHVQIYTYPEGPFRKLFEKMPESFKVKAKFSTQNSLLTLDGRKGGDTDLNNLESQWLKEYSQTLKLIFQNFSIPLPVDDEIKVCFATRGEYFYKSSASSLWQVPILFIGDACGGTDYKFGISLGRGLLTAKHLSEEMKLKGKVAFEDVVKFHNKNWQKIVKIELGKRSSNLLEIPEIFFKYIMNGRKVDGKFVCKKEFIDELRVNEKQKLRKTKIGVN
jgi:Alr-MurF fusion protein